MVNDFEENASVPQVSQEIVDVHLLDTLWVDPVFEDSDLSGFIGFWFGRNLDHRLFGKDQSVSVVENFGQQDSVEPGVSAENVFGLYWSFYTVLVAHVDDGGWPVFGRLLPVSLVPMVADVLQHVTIPVAVG